MNDGVVAADGEGKGEGEGKTVKCDYVHKDKSRGA